MTLRAIGGVALAIVFMPMAAIASLFGGKRDTSAEEVVEALRGHLQGSNGPWDWDEFTSVPLKDPALESIRSRALHLDDPTSDQSLRVIEGLLAEAEQL